MINIFYFIYEINRTGPGGARALVYFLPLLEIIFSVSFFIHFFFATSGTLKIRVVEIENMREYQFIFVCYEKRGVSLFSFISNCVDTWTSIISLMIEIFLLLSVGFVLLLYLLRNYYCYST